MGFLDRNKLLKKAEVKLEKVLMDDENPQSDFVYVREMSARERDRFEAGMLKEVVAPNGKTTYKRTMEDFRAKLAVATVCDENGVNVLTSNDIELLSVNGNAKFIDKIATAAQKLNGMDEKAVEEVTKNSEAAQSDNSTSD